jgi:hypothetical protein
VLTPEYNAVLGKFIDNIALRSQIVMCIPSDFVADPSKHTTASEVIHTMKAANAKLAKEMDSVFTSGLVGVLDHFSFFNAADILNDGLSKRHGDCRTSHGRHRTRRWIRKMMGVAKRQCDRYDIIREAVTE